MQCRSVLFDLEGVLLDSEAIWDRLHQALFASAGLQYERQLWKPRLAGLSNAKASAALGEALPMSPDAIAAWRMRTMNAMLLEGARWLPGAQDALLHLPPQCPRALTTAMAAQLFAGVDLRLGLRPLLAGPVFLAASLRLEKASGALFLYVARCLSLKARECLVIEDAPLAAAGARKAGMRVLALGTTFPRQAFGACDEFFSDWPAARRQSQLLPRP
ncbi:MAG: HAD family phosphatase [Leptospirales bacterium]|nr:HAD family phosphatase [Leptospirales bacterium]